MTRSIARMVTLVGLFASACVTTSGPGPEVLQIPLCATGDVYAPAGRLCGTVESAIGQPTLSARAYRGIPYAEALTPASRWTRAIARAPWAGRREAVRFGASCPQPPNPLFNEPHQAEDCLFVNVWTPANAAVGAVLPVIVFIHGGGYQGSSGSDPIYDPVHTVATSNAIVVTFNHRLGVLGYLAGVEALTGNYGFTDQQLALAWVRDNIAAFGGDPGRVTIWGHSSGAMAVALHLNSAPASVGLFQGAVTQSALLGFGFDDLASAGLPALSLMWSLGCSDLTCMRGLAADTIVKQPVIARDWLIFVPNWMPVIDGGVITGQPVTALHTSGPQVPTMFGTTADEGRVLVSILNLPLPLAAPPYLTTLAKFFGTTNVGNIISRPAYAIQLDNREGLARALADHLLVCANRHAMQAGSKPRFGYLFNQVSSFTWPSIPACAGPVACHAADLPYFFHSFAALPVTPTTSEAALSVQMNRFLGCFATNSDPASCGSVNTWPDFRLGEPRLQFKDVIQSMNGFAGSNCDLWDAVGYPRKL